MTTTAKMTAAARQIVADIACGNTPCRMISSVEICLDDVHNLLAAGRIADAYASLVRASSYAYGILDARHNAIVSITR